MKRLAVWLGMTGIGAGLLLGCRAETTHAEGGDQVKVATPFGGVQIKTNASAAENGMGLPVYPGATLVKKDDKGQDGGSADINLSFGSMQLRVKALSYQTSDAPEAVRSYYRKQLGRFGTVITCVDDRPVGEPTRTPEGLTCDQDKEGHGQVAATEGSYELKAGSKQHQHEVSIEKDGTGSKFAMVLLDLPTHFTMSDDDSKRQTE